MYKVSARQLILIAVISAVVTALMISLAGRVFHNRNAKPSETVEPTAIADPTVATDEQNNIEVYRAVSPGVVYITNTAQVPTFYGIIPQKGTGSGSVIDQDGHILTNYHVIENASQLEVQINKDKYSATLVGSDRDNDLAVIKVDAPRDKLTVVKLGSSTGLQVGQKVLAIGNPFGLQKTLTTGIISGLERPLRDPSARRTIQGAIQTDAAINPGNSGGPLLNSHGEMIGINTAIYNPSGGDTAGSIGIGFAVPVDIAKKIIPELISKGRVARPWLGISTLGSLTPRIVQQLGLSADSGLIVGDVYRGSGAAQAGLHGAVVDQDFWGNVVLRQLGDVILTVNGQPVASTDDLQNALKDKKPGDTVSVDILRQNRQTNVSVRLSDMPDQYR